jgi:DNA-binding SARP family transcriptional activator/tetratricopeptide (TPR) repeat protein
MQFALLGPLEVRDGDAVVPLGGGQQRALLALFLLHANETISRDRLIHELWGERPPATAAKALQGHISALRRLLEPDRERGGGGRVILTRGTGYELRLESEQLDLARHERLRGEGRRALAEGRPEEAAARVREALALWRGPPLADVAYERFAQGEVARLEELHVATLEDRFEADLAAGRHADVVGELELLVGRHPLRERLRGQLMLALYRAGRQADALAVFQETRRALVEELGIEPSRELQQLERAILRQDTALDRRPAAGRPVGLRAAPPAPPLVGRKRELSKLLDAFEDALAGRGRLVLVAGEPGIGKSRLADELAVRASARGAVTLFGRAWEAGGAPAYWPWVQALRTHIRAQQSNALREQLGAGGSDLAQLLPELRELFPDLPQPPSLESEGARFRLFDAVAAFLTNASRVQPLVLVLDDLHAADEPSLLLLQFLLQQLEGSRLLVLAAYRDVDPTPHDPLSTALARLAREPMTSRIALDGLAEGDVGEFISVTAGIQPEATTVAEIHGETDGNPLFVGEIVRLLAAEGALEVSQRSLRIPPGIREVIGSRVRRLSEECQNVLILASVLGREFSVDVLGEMSELPRDQLLDVLDEAMTERVVTDVPDASGRLRFGHALIRDTLYEELTRARRLRLHPRAADAIETVHAADLEPHLAELAHHLAIAVPVGDSGKAIDYARRAGDRAATLLAHEEAARLYTLAIETIESHAPTRNTDRCELLLQLGDVLARAGDIASAKETFLKAAEVARTAGMPEQLARAALGYGGRFVWGRAFGDTQLIPLLEEALDGLPEADSELRVRLLSRLSGGPWRDTLPPQRRVEMSETAVEMARRLGDAATLAYALNGRYSAHWGPEVLADRLAIADELIVVAATAGDSERAYEGHDARFIALLEAGDVRAASVELEAKARLAQELRQPAQFWDLAATRAQLALFEGRFEEAESQMREAVELGRSALARGANAQLAFDLQLYALRREQGRLEEVVDRVERAVDDYPANPVWRFLRADVLAELDRGDEARAAFEALAADDFRVDFEEEWLFSLSVLPDVCGYLEDMERAQVLYGLLRPYARRNAAMPPELCRGSVSRGLGILAAVLARWDDATRHFEDALEMNADMGTRPWLAHTQYDFAGALLRREAPGDRERARELATAARSVARELRMDALAAKVDTLPRA